MRPNYSLEHKVEERDSKISEIQTKSVSEISSLTKSLNKFNFDDTKYEEYHQYNIPSYDKSFLVICNGYFYL